MLIKVCGNNNEANLRELLTIQPDFVGFIFHPASRRFVGKDPGLIRFIASIRNTLKTGVFVNPSLQEVWSLTQLCGLDAVQLHGDESPELCRQIARSVPVVKAFGISQSFDFSILSSYAASCRYFLFDTSSPHHGGSGRKFDWSLLSLYQLPKPFFLSGGIGPCDVPAIKSIHHSALAGIDLNSRFETAAGVKDISELKIFFHEVRD